MMTYAASDLRELADRLEVAHDDHRFAGIARRAFAEVDRLRAAMAQRDERKEGE